MKKLLTLLIAVSMILSVLTIPAHAATAFPDIKGHWAQADIEAMAKAGYLTGYPDGTFRPDQPVTRAEFAKILCEVYDLPTSEYGWIMYDDIHRGDWYTPYVPAFYMLVFESFSWDIQSALDAGIITSLAKKLGGDYGWTFGAEVPMTRVETAAGIMMCSVFPEDEGEEYESLIEALEAAAAPALLASDHEDFDDDATVSFFMGLAMKRGIVTGDDRGRIRPYDTVSRAELCAVLNRTLSKYGGEADYYDVERIGKFNETLEEFYKEIYRGTVQPESAYDTPLYTGEFDDWAVEALRLVNIERASAGLSPLVLDRDLCAVAQLHSNDMAARNFFDHVNPDGKSSFDRMDDYGIRYMAAGENIACGQHSPREVVDDWMNSPGHRANILSSNYGKMGIAYAYGGSYGIYWTQYFTD